MINSLGSVLGITLLACALSSAWGEDMRPPQDVVKFPAATADGDVTVHVIQVFGESDLTATVAVTAQESGGDIANAVQAAMAAKGYDQVLVDQTLATFSTNTGWVSVEATNNALPLPTAPGSADVVVDGASMTVTWSVPDGSPAFDKLHVVIDGDSLEFAAPTSPLTISLTEHAIDAPNAADGNYRVALTGEAQSVRGPRTMATSHHPK